MGVERRVLSARVAWVEDEGEGGTPCGRGRWSFPHRIPHFAERRADANVERFRDVKADTRVAHLDPTTSPLNAEAHVRSRRERYLLEHPRGDDRSSLRGLDEDSALAPYDRGDSSPTAPRPDDHVDIVPSPGLDSRRVRR